MTTTKTIQLDFLKPYMKPVEVCEGDSCMLDIHMSVSGFPINITDSVVIFYVKKPDGSAVINPCDNIDCTIGHVQCNVKDQAFDTAGELRCWMLIIKGGDELRSMEFNVTVNAPEDETLPI